MKRLHEESHEPVAKRRKLASIASLSDEILLLVLGFLDVKSLVTAELVSTKFNVLARDGLIWKARYRHDFTSPRRLKRLSSRSLGTISAADAVTDAIDWKKRYKVRSNWSTGRCESTSSPKIPVLSEDLHPHDFSVSLKNRKVTITDLRNDTILLELTGSPDATVHIRTMEAYTIISITFLTYGLLDSTIQIQELVLSNETRSILASRSAKAAGPAVKTCHSQQLVYQHPYLILPSSKDHSTGQGNNIILYLVTSTPSVLSVSEGTRIDTREPITFQNIGICREYAYLIALQRAQISLWNLPSGTKQCAIPTLGDTIHGITTTSITTTSETHLTRLDFT